MERKKWELFRLENRKHRLEDRGDNQNILRKINRKIRKLEGR